MRRLSLSAIVLLLPAALAAASSRSGLLALPVTSASPEIAAVAKLYPELRAFYEELHANPELSLQEEKTAARMAKKLRALGYEVTEKVGGHGVVAVLKNGKGPTVMIRADMDGLPVLERTNLPYASKATGRNAAGDTVPVMHACGHDVHMTSLVGAATLLANSRATWRGTLVLVAQPAEEGGNGAKRMLKDGLVTRFPKPDFVIALHDVPWIPAGKVGLTPGFALANSDSVDITIYGRGGHGSTPQSTVDPILIAARTVVTLQSIVSREVDPRDAAVVTVGTFHGGTRRNIVPDEVKLEVTVRTFEEPVRRRVLAAIERIVRAEADAAGAPRPPSVVVNPEPYDATYNDPATTRKIAGAIARAFGPGNVELSKPVLGSEDFGYLGRAAKAPSVMLWLGASNPEKFAAAGGDETKLPSLHSSEWAPDVEPTLRMGTSALAVAALELLGQR